MARKGTHCGTAVPASFPSVPVRDRGKLADAPWGMAMPCAHPMGNQSHRVLTPGRPFSYSWTGVLKHPCNSGEG